LTGRPKLGAFSQKIEQLGGDDWFFDQVAKPTTMQKIAEQVGCSRPQLYMWMDAKEGRRERYEQAKKIAAHGYAEDSSAVVEELADKPVEPAMVQLAKLRAEQKWKMAAVLDRDTYGDKSGGVSLTIDIGQLHLEALKAKGSMQLAKPELAQFGIPGPSPAALPPPTILEGKVEPDTDEAA
jgi:hypothetical protein